MAGYVCTVASGKGGVGKTTTAVNVGAALASAEYDVVVVDADLGMADLAGTLNIDAEQTVHDVLAGEATVSDALTATQDGLMIVPGKQDLQAFAKADPEKLRTVINTLENTHDVVIIDTGSGLSHETAIPLGLADGIILVVTPDDIAIGDAKKTAQLADRVDGEIVGGLVTRIEKPSDVDGLESQLGYPLLGAIPADTEPIDTEPAVFTSPDSDRADAFARLTGVFESVFFQEMDPEEADMVYDPAWIGEETADEEGDTDDDDDDDDDGYSHAVFQGI